jgi:hypothetical protein
VRVWSLGIVAAGVICAAWLTVHSEEPTNGSKSQSAAKRNSATKSTTADAPRDDAHKEILSGKVVWLSEALTRRGIKNYPEESKGQVVLETDQGELIPIVSDWRGRAFYQDERLRDRPVDLVVHRRPGIPWVQVLSIFTFDERGIRHITDYWCDICAIPMYEIKECECCQGPIRLRFRPKELPADVPKHVVEKAETPHNGKAKDE